MLNSGFKSLFIVIIIFALSFGLGACGSSGSDDSELSGNLNILINAAPQTSFSLEVTTWDGRNLATRNTTGSTSASGMFEFEIESGDYEGVTAEAFLFGQAVDFFQLSLRSNGEILAETDSPDSNGVYVIEFGTLP